MVRSESVHRIQEAQDALTLALWGSVQRHLPVQTLGRHAGSCVVSGAAPDAIARNGTAATGDREAAVFGRIEAFRRRRPRLRDEVVTLAHGAGGKASAALLDAVFLPAFAPEDEAGHRPVQTDAALVDLPSGDRLAFSTDSYVVKPLRFPGGSAGHLAVHGTINDLAMMGARPIALSAAFVLEEGMSIDVLREVVADMARGGRGVPASDRHRRHQGGRPRRGGRHVHHHRRRRA